MLAAAREHPVSGDAIAAVDHDGLGVFRWRAGGRPPRAGRRTARVPPPVSGRQPPSRRPSPGPGTRRRWRRPLRDCFHHMEEGRGLHLLAVAGARDQHPEQPRLVHGGKHVRGDHPLPFDPVGRARDQRSECRAPARSVRRPRPNVYSAYQACNPSLREADHSLWPDGLSPGWLSSQSKRGSQPDPNPGAAHG